MKIIAQAPMRIDFAGGTMDLPPLYLFHHPAPTVNMAISINAQVVIEPADKITVVSKDQNLEVSWPDWQAIEWQTHPMLELVCRLVKSFEITGARIEIMSEAPAGSGLGGSSVIAIALTAALAKFTDRTLNSRELVEYAKSIETQSIKVPTGYQDYWGAVYGGVKAYQVALDGNLQVTQLGSAELHQQLQDHLMLVYVGKPHFSGANNWALFKGHIDNTNGVPEFFEKLKENGVAMQAAFEANDIAKIAEAANLDWQVRKSMLPTMTTPEIEQLTEKAMTAGAMALRVCGAGAGGCAMILVEPEKRAAVQSVVDELGMQTLNCQIAEKGVEVKVK